MENIISIHVKFDTCCMWWRWRKFYGGSGGTTDIEDLPDVGDYSTEETLQLSGMVTKGNVVEDNWVQKKLEEKFNVTIENTHVDTWDSDEVSILVASGDLPDTFTFTTGGMTPRDFQKQGLTRTIPREMIEKYAPLYAEMLDEVDNGLGWKMNLADDTDDEYTALVGLQSHTEGLLWAPTLRMDWMENLGIPIPDDAEPIGDSDGYERIYMTEHSYTIEELDEILDAFTNDDPNNSGKNDTYGMLPFNNNINWGLTLFGAYGVAPGYNLMENGELKHATISEKYRDTLIQLADWYDRGIIDPEWTTLEERTAWEKYQSDKIGYYLAQRAYIAQENWTEGRAPQNILDANPDAKLLVTGPEIGPEGDSGQPSYLPVTLLGDNHLISADVTDEELARYLQMYDFINHDPEGVWTNYGNPGEHSDWAGEPGKSTLIVRDEYDAEEGEMGFMSYRHRSYPGDSFYWLTHTKTIELMDNYFAKPEIIEKYEIRPETYDLFNETDWTEKEDYYGAQLTTLADEFRMNGITGEIDIEAEWDNYVQTYLDNGGQEIIDEMKKAPSVDELRGENPKASNVEPLDKN